MSIGDFSMESPRRELQGWSSWQAAVMAFQVTFASLPDEQLGDGDSYEFLESGVLEVKTATPAKIKYYAPGIWQTLLADHDHEPGSAKGPA